jgi:hypothetical protein
VEADRDKAEAEVTEQQKELERLRAMEKELEELQGDSWPSDDDVG